MFINATLTEYCADRGIEFTRSRAYPKNDQAWVEQKNGAAIRRFLGHECYSGQAAGQTIAHRHGVMWRYVNYFQSSPKLLEETRNGSATTKRYSPPASPCDRVIQHGAVSAEEKERYSPNAEPHFAQAVPWTQWRCCTRSGKRSRPWRRWRPRRSGRRHGARAWNDFWPGYPTGGVRSKSTPNVDCGRGRHGVGERGRTPSKVCGATGWAGCRKARTPAQCHCRAGCKRGNRIDSAGRTCARWSGECSSGEALWPTSWSTRHLKQA